MKLKNKFFTFTMILSISIPVFITGCDDSEMIQKMDVTVISPENFEGEIDITPSSAKNGESVVFKIKPNSIPTIIKDGKNVITIFYEIDGTKVAESSDVENNYSASYTVDGLSVGEHKITAGCIPSDENINLNLKIKSSTLTITE